MREIDSRRTKRFDALFESYSADIVAYCTWRSSAGSDPQDAVADVFLTAWRRLDEVPEGDAARVWLYATARRVMANHRRSGRRRIALHQRLEFEAASAQQEPASSSREEALVHEALRRLRAEDREILLLSEWEELSPAEIAAVLRCRAVTVRGRLHRARRRFRSVFEQLREQSDKHGHATPIGARRPAEVREGGS